MTATLTATFTSTGHRWHLCPVAQPRTLHLFRRYVTPEKRKVGGSTPAPAALPTWPARSFSVRTSTRNGWSLSWMDVMGGTTVSACRHTRHACHCSRSGCVTPAVTDVRHRHAAPHGVRPARLRRRATSVQLGRVSEGHVRSLAVCRPHRSAGRPSVISESSKLAMRVRFPSPAPCIGGRSVGGFPVFGVLSQAGCGRWSGRAGW